MIPLLILFIRRLILRNKNVPVHLYAEALKKENSGYFETAFTVYEKALQAANKTRFQDKDLRDKITEKLKILHTVIEYKNGFRYSR